MTGVHLHPLSTALGESTVADGKVCAQLARLAATIAQPVATSLRRREAVQYQRTSPRRRRVGHPHAALAEGPGDASFS